MNRPINRFLLKALQIAAGFIFVAIFLNISFASSYFYGFDFLAQNLTFVAFLVLFLVVLLFIRHKVLSREKIKKLAVKHESKIWVLAFCLLLAVQTVFILLLWADAGWDCGFIFWTATKPDMQPDAGYFSVYPHTLFLLFIYRFAVIIASVLHVPVYGIWVMLDILNMFAIDLALLFAVLLAREIYGKKTAIIVFVLGVMLLGFFPWLVIPYADTLVMPFIIGFLYFCYKTAHSGNSKKKYIFGVAAGLFFVIGMLLKPTTLIVAIAAGIIYILFLLDNPRARLKTLKYIACMVAFVALLQGGYSVLLSRQSMMQVEPGKAHAFSSYILVGLSKTEKDGLPIYGGWNREDMYFAQSFGSTEEMDAACKKEIANRIEKMGPFGYMQFLTAKLGWITADGTFFWGKEGDFLNYYRNDINSLPARTFYPIGDLYAGYQYAAQAVWMLVLLGLTFSISSIKKFTLKDLPTAVLWLSILGLLLFLLISEGRSRYLISFLPIFILLAGRGYSSLLNWLEKFKKHEKKA